MRRHVPGIVISILALAGYRYCPQWISKWELKTYDFRMGYVRRRPGPEIVIVTVDTKTIWELGGYPLNRKYFTQLTKQLSGAGAKIIGFDINFVKADPEDDAFAAAIHDAGNVVMGELFEEGARPGAPEPFRQAEIYSYQASETREGTWSFGSVRANSDPINFVAHNDSAFVNVDLDSDLELRRAALAARNGTLYYTPFSIVVSRRYLGVDRGGMRLDLRPDGLEHIDIGNIRVPTDESATLLINFRGGKNAFSTFSFLDVIRGRIPAGIFKGKIVLIGVSDGIAHDIWDTPVGSIPGTEALAHEIDSILGQCGISDHVEAFVLLIPLMGWGGCWWLGRARPRMILPWTVAILVVFVALETLLFARWGIWLPMVYPTLVLLAGSLWTIQIRLKADA